MDVKAILARGLSAIILLSGGAIADGEGAASGAAYKEYCASVTFRETPFADIRCGRKLRQQTIGEMKHFQLDYDGAGRLTEVRYQQGTSLRAYSDRFVRAPRIAITYQNDTEIRTFYNEWGHRALVSGDVYEVRFNLDAEGVRKAAHFYGLDGQPVNNDFGIAKYEWDVATDGDVIERRYNLAGELVRNRPGFGYMITRFSYDARGLLAQMDNLGTDGLKVTADEAGIVSTRINYDHHGQFTGWVNLNAAGNPQRGMSDIAIIRYLPSRYASEEVATFIDADGTPQTTGWGAHQVIYSFDVFGNAVDRKHYDTSGQLTGTVSGVARIVSRWTQDGAYHQEDQYFDTDDNPVASSYSKIHKLATQMGKNGRPAERSFLNLAEDVITHPGLGYATEYFIFDAAGRLTERGFRDADGSPADHRTWGVARFTYTYDGTNLTSARAYKADGTVAKPLWNPAH
ncbi:hypothetical protein GCM10017044_12260 [Kordiimonas sediminis]|uniref:RHS repeat protein n=1 Tax=Kordiimonas sediminis TaxID=1735581 RepID=A0A919E6M5_9PROT|nr:hypothetical protein [Kordiimonas sediminis]GHF19254.1 hypothetical protein GCM10017044_12260 [Kordiimonas sediminis]